MDGLNLLYGIIKGSNCDYRDVDIFSFVKSSLPKRHNLVLVKYYISIYTDRKRDDQLLNIERIVDIHGDKFKVILGDFRQREKQGLCPICKVDRTFVKWEEKGTDVNLASDIVWDSFDPAIDCIALVSDDSDMSRALEKAKKNNKHVLLLSPIIPNKDRRPSANLVKYSDVKTYMKRKVMRKSLLTKKK